MNEKQRGAQEISLFCRLNMNSKRELPVRASEMGLLIFVVKSEAPVTPVMAAEFFKVSKPMIASMVKNLCQKNYLRKIPSKEDKRSVLLIPEDSAVRLVEETWEEYLKNMTLLMSRMGEKKFASFLQLLHEANSILEKERTGRNE